MVYIERIIRKMKQGQTGPYLCVGDNGNQYIVKGPNTTYRGLINEWVCGQLGKALGIPIPDDRNLTEYGGNPNLFICSDLCSFVVLDHNLAFDREHDQIFESLKRIHVASTAWFTEQKDLFDKEYYESRLEDAMKELDSILESVPEEWLDNCGDDSILKEIRTTLSRFRLPEFWEGIK